MIKVKNLSKIYENGTIAVDNISFELPSIGMVAITGTSGCGKSTLLNLLSNNDIPSKGELLYNDKPYGEYSKDILTKDFAYIYQDFKLIDNLTVYQNIMIGHELANKDIDYENVINIAKELGIFEILDEKVYSLSGGQQQRVAIARSLARNPKVIFADEPTGNLDGNNSINVYNILRKLANEKLVIIVSHDMQISTWADRVISLSDGTIIADEAGKAVSEVEIEKTDKTTEEEEIEEILQMQKTVESKKSSKFFSYNKIPKRKGKKARLSGKSSLGLSLALLNKDKIKKIFLIIVMIILISFMTLSCAMTFATVEKTMANSINATAGKKVFAVSPVIGDSGYVLTKNDMQAFDKLLEESGLDYSEIANGEVIAHGFNSMNPVDEDAEQIVYFAPMELSNINNAVFTDNPSEIGLKILLGKAPQTTDEIAISNTLYEYLLHYKKFEIYANENTEIVEFTKDNFLNNDKIVSIFGVKLCGVFDDKNSLDSSLKEKTIEDIAEKDWEKTQNIISEEYANNPLINLVIKCEQAYQDWSQFAGVNSRLKMSLENCYGFNNVGYCFDFAPINSAVANYYRLSDEVKNLNLGKNEIAIDKMTLDKINEFLKGEQVGQGSELPMCVVGMGIIAMQEYRETTYLTENVTIAKVVDDFGAASGTILMNEETYNTFNVVGKFSEKRLVYGDRISASSLGKLNKGFVNYTKDILNKNGNNYVTYSIPNCPMTKANDYDFIYICQEYVCVPLMIVTIAMAIGIIVVFYNDFVKTKAKDLLILKSLGANSLDFLNIYGIFSLVLTAVQVLFGLLTGNLLIYLINILGSSVSGYSGVFSIFYLDSVSWVFTLVAVLVINVISLVISLAGISNKNLRKAFQKLKK